MRIIAWIANGQHSAIKAQYLLHNKNIDNAHISEVQFTLWTVLKINIQKYIYKSQVFALIMGTMTSM